MTQRYKITTQITPTLGGDYDVVAIAVPDDHGDYVRHDAVSHLTEEKTIEQHRSEFELWGKTMANWIGERNHFDEYSCQTEQFCWLAWKAARGITE